MSENSSNGVNNGSAKGWKGIFLRTWHPTPTVNTTILLFSVLGLIFVIFGIVLFVINSKIREFSVRYDPLCKNYGANCDINIEVTEEMESPVFVFYELHNFYQNHRRYIKSKSASQLSGDVIDKKAAQTACDPVITNKDMGVSIANDKVTTLKEDEVASPCGLIAKSFFNDTFKLTTKSGEEIKINDKGITWPNDVGKKYKRASNYMTTQWIDPEDEHFVVWMRTAGLPDFRKLWGKIEKNIPKGNYTFQVSNHYNVNRFNGEKHIVLSTSGPFGGKNSFLAISYVVIGSICFLIAIIFFVKNKMSGGTFGESKKNE